MTRRNLFPTLLAAAALVMLSACADLNLATESSGARSQDTTPYANAQPCSRQARGRSLRAGYAKLNARLGGQPRRHSPW